MGARTYQHVIIIGTGFAGLSWRYDYNSTNARFVVLERPAEVGGTWRDNSYPGCACDVPSALYFVLVRTQSV